MDVDIVPILEHYGFDVPDPEPGDVWTKILCEFHGESNPSASYNQFAFNCFACGVRGDAFALIMGEEGLDFAGAIRIVEELLGESLPEVPRGNSAGRRRLPDRSGNRAGGNRGSPAGRRRRPFAGS